MKRVIVIMLLLVAVCAADTAVESGLNVGDRAPAHHPYHVTGDDAGTTICPV